MIIINRLSMHLQVLSTQGIIEPYKYKKRSSNLALNNLCPYKRNDRLHIVVSMQLLHILSMCHLDAFYL